MREHKWTVQTGNHWHLHVWPYSPVTSFGPVVSGLCLPNGLSARTAVSKVNQSNSGTVVTSPIAGVSQLYQPRSNTDRAVRHEGSIGLVTGPYVRSHVSLSSPCSFPYMVHLLILLRESGSLGCGRNEETNNVIPMWQKKGTMKHRIRSVMLVLFRWFVQLVWYGPVRSYKLFLESHSLLWNHFQGWMKWTRRSGWKNEAYVMGTW